MDCCCYVNSKLILIKNQLYAAVVDFLLTAPLIDTQSLEKKCKLASYAQGLDELLSDKITCF